MIRVRVWHALTVMICFAITANAQRVGGGIVRVNPQPSAAERSQMLTRLTAQLEQHPANLTCTQSAFMKNRLRSILDVYLVKRPMEEQSAVDWDRYEVDAGYNSF